MLWKASGREEQNINLLDKTEMSSLVTSSFAGKKFDPTKQK
jgi:hypothetical protein